MTPEPNAHNTAQAGADRLEALESDVRRILERNARVERDKQWETSRTRLAAVTVIIYITMVLVFSMFGSTSPLIDAMVPTLGFGLSSLSLPFVREVWEKVRRMRR